MVGSNDDSGGGLQSSVTFNAIAGTIYRVAVDGFGGEMGNITLHYDRTVPGLQRQLADLQFQYIDEVISSLHVQLSHQQVMEVILVQGQAKRLQRIADEMSTRRGVIAGRLQLLAAIMPPIQLSSPTVAGPASRPLAQAAAPTKPASRPRR